MVIKNKFNSGDIERVSKQIYIAIQNEIELTKRSLEYIQKELKIGNFYIAINNNGQIVGFISKVKLLFNYYEIRSLYIFPNRRHKGIGGKLIKSAISDNSHKYLSSTFQAGIVEKLKHFGFMEISLFSLPISVLIKYIATRNLVSIRNHIFIKRSYLLQKYEI